MNVPKDLAPIDYTPSGYVFNPKDELMTYEEWRTQRLHTMRALELMFSEKEESNDET